MVTQQVPARSEGRKAMDDALSPAERLGRQLKAGRLKLRSALPASVFDAVHRLMGEALRADTLSQKYGLPPATVALALVLRVHNPTVPPIQAQGLPGSRRLTLFIDNLEKMSDAAPVDFLGILWQIDDLVKQHSVIWATPFAQDTRTVLDLLTYKNQVTLELEEKLRMGTQGDSNV
ncbi:MAG TPA: hypothetical protein VK814_01680 [Acidobacteriaceae bacterium]|jgi:hypothetical protein|nr:hypothetical protein [Acidobacteriaceae bacterium]